MKKKSKQSKQRSTQLDQISKSLEELSFKDHKRRILLINQLLKKTTFYNNNVTNNSQLLEENKEINGLINDIIAIERELTIDLPKRNQQNWGSLKEWLKDNSIDLSKVDIQWIDDNHGFGLKATKDITESELILDIPRKVMMSCETALKDKNLELFIKEDPLLQNMPNIVLALHLIDEYCRTDSFWRPYLSCLPSSYGTVLYLNEEDINQLKGSQVFEEAIQLKRSIGRQFAYFSNQMRTNQMAKNLSFKKFFTYELYRWAVSTVMTRQNSIPSSDGQSMISALIPLWDMSNHKQGKISTDFNVETDSGVCYAMEDYKSGQQIFIHYGLRSNGEFFVHNGFVYSDNSNDFLPLRLGISRNDSLFQQKYELCKRLDLNVSGAKRYHLYNKSQPIDPKLLAFLRVFHLNKAELEFWSQNDNICEFFDPFAKQLIHLNDKIEEFLRNRSVILLMGYPKPESQLKYKNPIIQQLIISEVNLLKSYIQ